MLITQREVTNAGQRSIGEMSRASDLQARIASLVLVTRPIRVRFPRQDIFSLVSPFHVCSMLQQRIPVAMPWSSDHCWTIGLVGLGQGCLWGSQRCELVGM